MSKSRKRRSRRAQTGSRTGPVVFTAMAALAAAVFYLFGGASEAAAHHHPEPEPGVTAEKVVPAERYAGYGRIADVYTMAAAIPGVLDGLYCHCECSEHAGHRSLLSCFESDHGANCDVCLSEAELAYRMTRDGKSLDEIRATIDGLYGDG